MLFEKLTEDFVEEDSNSSYDRMTKDFVKNNLLFFESFASANRNNEIFDI